MKEDSILKNIRHFLSIPFIYSMIFPSIVFHLCLEIYHQICFRLYGIPLVQPMEYFLFKRKLLKNLKMIEKINCIYCSYVNNLIKYAMEIGARTERYWCPIKYNDKVNQTHSQYKKFLQDGACEEMREKWMELRDFSDL